MKPITRLFFYGLLVSTALSSIAAEPETKLNDSLEESESVADKEETTEAETITVYGRHKEDTLYSIPQGVAVFDQNNIELTSSTTVGDMIRLLPTASRNGSTLNAFGDDYLIRGFAASQTINGLGFNRVAHARNLANVERIEVLKGPASVLYGQMEPGAAINVVTKQPLDYFQANYGLELGSYSNQRYTMDITGPFSDDVRGRLNLSYQDSESFIDFWDLKQLFVAPNVTMDLSDNTELTLEGSYTTNDWDSFQNGRPAYGAFLPNPNGQYNESFNPDEEFGFTSRDSIYTNLRLEHRFSEDTKFRASYGYTRNDADFKEMFVIGLQDDMRTLDRAVFVGKDTFEKDHNLLLDLTGSLQTGSITHNYVVGVNYREFNSSRPTRFYLTTTLDLFEPVYGLAEDFDPDLRQFFQDFHTVEGFIQNRISLSENFKLLAGIRYTDSEQDTLFINTDGEASPDTLNETSWTSQFGALYEMSNNWTLYTNRSEAFVPQFGTSSGGTPFDAEESTQYEVGTRTSLSDSSFSLNAALFNIRKENLLTVDPTNPEFEAALGEVQSKGLELSTSGYINGDWLLAAAYGYTKTEIVRNFDGLEGNRLRNTPEHTVSLQTRYDLTSEFGLGVTIEYLDSRFGDDDNSFKLPSHTRIDLGAYYQVTPNIQLDFLVNNITDEDIYAEGYSPIQVIQEPGRTYLLRFKLNTL